jgi:hypothetical protein
MDTGITGYCILSSLLAARTLGALEILGCVISLLAILNPLILVLSLHNAS